MLMGAGPQRPTQTIKMFFRSVLNVQSLSRSATLWPGKGKVEDVSVPSTLRNERSNIKSHASSSPPPPISQDAWMKAPYSEYTRCLHRGDEPAPAVRL